MLEKGKRIPSLSVQDWAGESHDLWNYRQKSHLVLLYDPSVSADVRAQWEAALRADQKQWDWLNAKVLLIKEAPKELSPGAYVIDRYGMLWNYFTPGHWNFEDLEKDLVYYEARHC